MRVCHVCIQAKLMFIVPNRKEGKDGGSTQPTEYSPAQPLKGLQIRSNSRSVVLPCSLQPYSLIQAVSDQLAHVTCILCWCSRAIPQQQLQHNSKSVFAQGKHASVGHVVRSSDQADPDSMSYTTAVQGSRRGTGGVDQGVQEPCGQ